MSFSPTTTLPRHLRPRREKIFGERPGLPLDGNAKARIMVFAHGWNAKHKEGRQHRGPITRAMMEVLEALLWGFHNSKTGFCYPSYERIAEKAQCNRDTVYEAIQVLERANVLTWVNRIVRTQVRELDLFGKMAWRWKIIRTSNAYLFRDPLPCHTPQRALLSSKSENPPETKIQEVSSLSTELSTGPRIIVLDPDNPNDRALISLGRTMGALPMPER